MKYNDIIAYMKNFLAGNVYDEYKRYYYHDTHLIKNYDKEGIIKTNVNWSRFYIYYNQDLIELVVNKPTHNGFHSYNLYLSKTTISYYKYYVNTKDDSKCDYSMTRIKTRIPIGIRNINEYYILFTHLWIFLTKYD